MPAKKKEADGNAVSLQVVEPYDFALSLRVVRSFGPASADPSDRLHLAVRIGGAPVLIEISQSPGVKGRLRASATPAADSEEVRKTAEWVLFDELDLGPFYRLTDSDPKLAGIVEGLRGLKPMRPVSLFEMAVVAITEQQISLAAAYRIRSRIVQRFGTPINDEWVFPEPLPLASASLDDLRSCGLSRQKAQYIHDLAAGIVDRTLDLDFLKTMDDDTAREVIMKQRGFGRWSADYILIRGLARPDYVPIDDLAIRSVVGEYLGDGQRVTSAEAAVKLEPFRPYRGLLAFYLLARHRLKPTG